MADGVTSEPDGTISPICVIQGMAGVGKTALAVHAARLLADRFPDGTLFVDLGGNSRPVDPHQALERVLRSLRIPAGRIPADLDERAALYRSRLFGRRMLVVFDDATSAGQVFPLLPPAPAFTLVTSRRRLTALDEATMLTLDVLSPADAVTLLRRLTGPSTNSRDALEQDAIVERCGFHPLAIRICAAILRSHPTRTTRDLLDQLTDPLTALNDGERSIQAVLDSAYNALTQGQQRLLRALATAPDDGATLDTITALAGTTRGHTTRLLDQLLQASLIVMTTGTGPPRYHLHDLVRAYASRTAST